MAHTMPGKRPCQQPGNRFMRISVLILASLLASPAAASSIDLVKGMPAGKISESMMHISCEHCAPAPAVATSPVLKPGEQTVELKMIDGEQKIVRTEAWLGGSPVVFVSAATPEAIALYFPNKNVPADGVDEMNKTAAVPASAQPSSAAIGPAAGAPSAAPLDVSGMSLRSQ